MQWCIEKGYTACIRLWLPNPFVKVSISISWQTTKCECPPLTPSHPPCQCYHIPKCQCWTWSAGGGHFRAASSFLISLLKNNLNSVSVTHNYLHPFTLSNKSIRLTLVLHFSWFASQPSIQTLSRASFFSTFTAWEQCIHYQNFVIIT